MQIIFEIVRKEFLQLIRDRRMLPVVIITPVFLLILFGYAVTTDIKNISWAVIDQDKTFQSRQLLRQFTGTGYFNQPIYIKDLKEAEIMLDKGRANVVINIPPEFQKKIKARRKSAVQVLIDGTDSNSARIIMNYVEGIIQSYNQNLLFGRVIPFGIVFENRIWFNPDLKSVNYMVPGTICQIIFMITIVLTALAIVREKEAGTMELLMVSPIRPYQLIFGKIIPFVAIAMIDTVFIITVGYFWFKVQIAGNLIWLFLSAFIFVVSSLALGILVSTVSRTQQQAMISFMFVQILSVLLSGFMFPIENMPQLVQYVTYIIPLKYFLIAVRGIYMKGTGIFYLQHQIYPLIVIGFFFMSVAIARFKKKMS